MFRLIFYVFGGSETHRIAAVPRTMIYPMVLLALFSIVAGLFNLPPLFGGGERFSAWLGLNEVRPHLAHAAEYMLIAVNLLVITSAIYWAYLRYGAADAPKEDIAQGKVARLIEQKFYVDETYHLLFVKPLRHLSTLLDEKVSHDAIDRNIHRITFGYIKLGMRLKVFHNGNIRFYALYMMLGISLFFVYLYLGMEV
jgi:NADH-quinone oxidoreductase subunit L